MRSRLKGGRKMNKEELKQEAEEWIVNNSKDYITNPNYSPFDYAEAIYLAGAEPREKRVAELEAQIEKMKCCYNCKHSRTEYEHCRTDKHEKWEIKEK